MISRRDPPVLPARRARAQASEAAMILFHPPPAANGLAALQPLATNEHVNETSAAMLTLSTPGSGGALIARRKPVRAADDSAYRGKSFF